MYSGSGVTQTPLLWISSNSFRGKRRQELKSKGLPSSATYVKNTGRPRQKGTFTFSTEHRGRVGSIVVLCSEGRAFIFRSENELLLEGCRGFIMLYREISKQCPKFGQDSFLTNLFPFCYSLITVHCIYLPLAASLNRRQ
jgi:hypothetical protein